MQLERLQCYLSFKGTILVLREEFMCSLYRGNLCILICHTGCFLKQESRALHSTVIRIIEVPQHFTILLSGVDLEQPSGWSETLSTILEEPEEVAQWQAFVQMEQDMINWPLG